MTKSELIISLIDTEIRDFRTMRKSNYNFFYVKSPLVATHLMVSVENGRRFMFDAAILQGNFPAENYLWRIYR